MEQSFDFDDLGQPQENMVIYNRLNELEKYCYQTRIKD